MNNAIKAATAALLVSISGAVTSTPAAASGSTAVLENGDTMQVIRANGIRETISAQVKRTPQATIPSNVVRICLYNQTGGTRMLTNSSRSMPGLSAPARGSVCKDYDNTLDMNFGGRDAARAVSFANQNHVNWNLRQYGGASIDFVWAP